MSSVVHVTLPDGSVREFPQGITIAEAVAQIGRGLAKAALAAKVDDRLVDLSARLTEDCQLRILTFADEEGREVFRHTSTHIMAQAVKRLFPEAKLTVGPPLENSFYYDFDLPRPLTPEDLERIEAEMAKIVAADYPIVRQEVDREEAKRFFAERGEDYKVLLVDKIPEDEVVSIYTQGEFTDLCVGPHLPSTGRVKAFKLLSVAGAYWEGNQANKQLQRVYGTSFESKKDLDQYLFQLEEAKRRDHRKLGPELGLFRFEEVAPGFAYWLDKGYKIYRELENWSRSLQAELGYQEVRCPWIVSSKLYETSGHWQHYRQNMFTLKAEDQDFAIKPMNCPNHCVLYRSELRSYRDLPLKVAEYGPLSRFEASGTLHGLLRVRGFHQDDAHLFVRPDQIEEMIREVIGLVDTIYGTLGLQYEIKLSTRPEDFMGEIELWDQAEAALARALEGMGRSYKLNPGDGAFYGPKLDFDVTDALGRKWQCATVQLDFQMPIKFDLTYIGEDGKEHRPVMIHRAIMGTLERFIGILTEHYAGNFPVWMAPVQARVLPITDRHHEYAAQVVARLKAAGLRVENDTRNEKIGYKIREAEVQKIPFILVVGDKEAQAGAVAVRRRGMKDLGPMPLEAFMELVQSEIASKAMDDACLKAVSGKED
ncbi:MAG: threonine--tRNA ligase [Symbiobacterium sp.]|uniref:threonine--tRNA ligase n=1 Tax=Symbiobacterium sp. TaxID=1971213 RepID=UPI003463BC6D